jgi:hypothetical protein
LTGHFRPWRGNACGTIPRDKSGPGPMPGIISSGYICIITPKKFIVNWLLSSDSYLNPTEQESVDFLELIGNHSQSKHLSYSIGSLIAISEFILRNCVVILVIYSFCTL